MTSFPDCIFCRIISGSEPASLIHEDDRCIAFMTLRPTRPGECTVIPKTHIDHYTDMPDDLAAHIAVIAQHIGRNIMQQLTPLRVGMVVHGFGVAHAHLILVPQHDPHDIASGRHAYIEDGEIQFSNRHIPLCDREELDRMAALLRP